jgi:hypothetical protein
MPSIPSPRIRATLAEDPAPLSALNSLGESLSVLAASASWPTICLDPSPEGEELREALRRDAFRLYKELITSPRGRSPRRAAPSSPGDIMRLALLLDVLSPGERPGHFDEAQRELKDRMADLGVSDTQPGTVDMWDELAPTVLGVEDPLSFRHDRNGPPGWMGDLFYVRYFKSRVIPRAPQYNALLDILDARSESPPTITIGLNSVILNSAGVAAVVDHYPYLVSRPS